MKNPKDEDFYLLIPDPITGEKKQFDLERQGNAGLALRLIKKRERLTQKSMEKYDKVKELRKKHNVDQLEKRTEDVLSKIGDLSLDDFESAEEYEKKEKELENQLEEIRDAFPEKLEKAQNETAKIMSDLDRVGIRICTLVLNPTNGLPPEYDSKKDFIEEYIADDQDIQDVINFFLSTLNSTTMSRRGTGIEMKSRSKNQKME